MKITTKDKRPAFIKSNFERKKNDDYRTIDDRCVYGLLTHFALRGHIVDVCAPDGSGIVDTLIKLNRDAHCVADAFVPVVFAEWIVTNPPFTRPLVDQIIHRQIERIDEGQVKQVAILLRGNFDFAKSRSSLFENPFYFGQIRLRFRPWWSDVHKHQPFHNFVWHIWSSTTKSAPIVMYSDGTP